MPHRGLLHEGLNKFRLDGSYCDVTIRVEEKTFQCHRVVLASVCEYFNCLFGSNFKESCSQVNDITLHDIDAKSFSIILEFIYLGRYPFCHENNIYGLLRSSDFLQLQTIKNYCVEYILREASSLSSGKIFEVFLLACGMNDSLLVDTLSKYCVDYLQDFLRRDIFLEMACDDLNSVLQRYRLSNVIFKSEDFLLDALVRWVYFSSDQRQKFFQKLIDTIDFDKISRDCVEFLLKEYATGCEIKIGSNQNTTAALKTLLLDGFSLNKFVGNDDVMPMPYQDLSSEITPSIYIYGKRGHGGCYKRNFTVFSLNEPDSCHTEDSRNSSNPSASVNLDWAISCTFSMRAVTGLVLTTSNKSNHIYYLSGLGEFRAYNSIDLSSDQYTELATLESQSLDLYGNVDTCETDDGNIYFCLKEPSKIHCYNFNVDKWFPELELKTKAARYTSVFYNNLLYFIEGRESNWPYKNLDNYVQVYDCRTPRLLDLSTSRTKKSAFSSSRNEYCPASCVVDGKIYVYNGNQFKLFDPVAGKWTNIKAMKPNGQKECISKWPVSDNLKLISYKKQLFVFGTYSEECLTYNLITNTCKKSALCNYDPNEESFSFTNVIVSKAIEM